MGDRDSRPEHGAPTCASPRQLARHLLVDKRGCTLSPGAVVCHALPLPQGKLWVYLGDYLTATGNATTNAYFNSGARQFDCYEPLTYWMNPATVCGTASGVPGNALLLPWFISGECQGCCALSSTQSIFIAIRPRFPACVQAPPPRCLAQKTSSKTPSSSTVRCLGLEALNCERSRLVPFQHSSTHHVLTHRVPCLLACLPAVCWVQLTLTTATLETCWRTPKMCTSRPTRGWLLSTYSPHES